MLLCIHIYKEICIGEFPSRIYQFISFVITVSVMIQCYTDKISVQVLSGKASALKIGLDYIGSLFKWPCWLPVQLFPKCIHQNYNNSSKE